MDALNEDESFLGMLDTQIVQEIYIEAFRLYISGIQKGTND